MNKIKTKDMALISILVALVSASSLITIPTFFVPITLQTLFVFIIAFLLNFKLSFIAIFLYILLGVINIPVFAGGVGGIGIIFGYSGGFLLSFLLVVPLMSFINDSINNKNQIICYFLISILGTIIIYLIGMIWFSFVTETTLIYSFNVSVLKFIPFDLIKIIIASITVSKIKKIDFN